MLPKIWIFDTYTICIFIGLILCFTFLNIYFAKIKLQASIKYTSEIIGLISIIFGFIFSILFQNLFFYIASPDDFKFSTAMTFYGGVIAGIITYILVYVLFYRKKYPTLLKEMSIIAPACITIAHGFGRLGCFFNGCCYGIPTSSPIGVTFPHLDHAVIPTNLIEAIFLIILSLILFFLAIKHKNKFCFSIYLITYGIFRFVIEFYRGDDRGAFIEGLSPSQFWSILYFVAGVSLLIYIILKHPKKLNS